MRTWTWLIARLALLLGTLTVSSPLHAQEESARERFRRGQAAYQQGNYNLAITEWQAAYDADPRPRIQYNLYQAHERLGQLTKAAEALQRYLGSADPEDPYYSDATARMASLQQRLQATGVRIVGGVDGASIDVSGHDWGRLPRPDRIPVQPGNHRIVIQLDGYKDFVANVVVPAGQVVDVPVQLERITDAGPADAPPVTTPEKPTTTQASLHVDASDAGDDPMPFFIASAGLGAGAIVSGVWAANRIGELDGCDDPDFFCPEEDAVSTQGTIAIVLTAALGAGAIGTLVYGLILNSEDGDDESAASPACIASPLGAHCSLRF